MFRTGVVCGGWTLQAQQPQNNIVRVAYQAMAAVLGGVQSMFTAAWDEPFALPTEESTTLALRTQQILAHETGVTRTVDPLGGSYFVESLTDAMEEKIVGIMADLEARGGMVRCIEDGYVQRLIADESAAVQRKIDRGERVIVGVNKYESDQPAPMLQPPAMDDVARKLQLDRLAEVRRTRNSRAALGRARPPAQRRGRRREPDATPDRVRRGVLHRRGDHQGAQGRVGRVPAADGVLMEMQRRRGRRPGTP